MKLTSTAFTYDTDIPVRYTCDGGDINPPLRIEDVPEDTKSFALIMDDPDVPRRIQEDGVWDHWIVFNIPPNLRYIPENTEPQGVHGKCTSGNTAYHGPCPPDRKHRYVFTLYALDSMLDIPEGSSKQEVFDAMDSHILVQAELTGLYARTQTPKSS